MASIRLFGRGKNAAVAAAGGPAVGAALIADVLEGLTAASMSTTWRCRHASGVSIGEGAVDFSARRSRSTVIRGKYTFEYVRSGANAYRTAVTDEDAGAAGMKAQAAAAALADEDEDEAQSEDLEASEDEPEFEDGDEDEAEGEEGDADEDEDEDPDAEFEGAFEGEGDEEDVDGDDGDESDEDLEAEGEDEGGFGGGAVPARGSGLTVSASVAGSSAWEKFSESDACGVHAYAEPAVLAAGVRAAGVVQAREAQEFDGVMLSAYSVTLKPKPGDPNRVLARLARQLRDHGANVVVVTAFVDPSQQDGEDGDGAVSLNGDGAGSADGIDGEGAGARIVRLRIELPHWTPADDPTADHSVSVDLFEFGEPVSVEVPEGAGRRTARSCADMALF